VHLGDGEPDAGQGVAQHHRGVREPARVDHDAGAVLAGGVDGIQQHALVVALHGTDLEAAAGRGIRRHPLDVGERRRPVQGRLPGAQEVQVGAVDEEQAARNGHAPTLPG
jgi:hypothetical protein